MTTAPNRPVPGDPAPHFRAAVLDANPNFVFGTVAGRHILMLFHGSAARPQSRAALDAVLSRRALFDDHHACFFGITTDPTDAAEGRIAPMLPGIRHFLDYDRAVSIAYGAAGEADGSYDPHWLILDSGLRILARLPIEASAQALDLLGQAVAAPVPEQWAPVLRVPYVLEPTLCARLIALYEETGGEESGFMREVAGKTTLVVDHGHKRRSDVTIEDAALCGALAARVKRRIAGPLQAAFQNEMTRMERYIVACYDAEHGGHFKPHRDNTTKGTAHRRFAITINLNAEDYEGGDLRFPEFGMRPYRAPTGGAIVFSCSLLHEVTPITRGKRYAFLPFLYDETAAQLRERNNPFLDKAIGSYSAGLANGHDKGDQP